MDGLPVTKTGGFVQVSRSIRGLRGVVGVVAIATVSLLAPSVASANVVDNVVDNVKNTVDGLLGSGGGSPAPAPAPSPDAGTPPDYTPPAHGSDQHAQGTGATVDLTPSEQLPLPYDPDGGSEDVVAGGSRGSFDGDDYHGHVTILALLGNELLEGADTAEGQTSNGPLGDVNALLGDICTSTGLCLSALDVSSETTGRGSANSFSVATANLTPAGLPVLDLGAVQSSGEISQAGGCRTAEATGSVANANVAGITANAINSSSKSRACRDGSESQTNDSSVLGIGGVGVPLPQPGCEDGVPNTSLLLGIANLVCNANDSNGIQLRPPYGVREGLTVFAVGTLVKATTAAAESRARAPRGGAGGGNDDDGDGVPNGEDDCPNKPGPASNDGCPLGSGGGGNGGNDDDGDGVPNGEDECPQVPGPVANDGCPLGVDTDGDGILDSDDACPTVPGPASNDGCPLGVDTDGDGIVDSDDACPTVPGPASNDGCPLAGAGGAGGGPSSLAFTGADLLTLSLIGLGIAGGGLALMALADRRRRTSALG